MALKNYLKMLLFLSSCNLSFKCCTHTYSYINKHNYLLNRLGTIEETIKILNFLISSLIEITTHFLLSFYIHK